MMEEPTALVGVDWASAEHQVCALGPAGPVQRAFLHDAAGLGAMVDWLSTLADRPDLVAVAIETPHGPVVEALMDRGLAVYAINPKQLDRFRDRFSPAGAKDDRRDALVLASSLRTDRHCFRRLEVLDPTVVELREWSRMFDELKEERARLTNRIRQQLWRYYPQALELVDDPGSDWFLDVLALAPTPDTAGKLTEKKLGRVLNLHRIRKISATDALEVLKRPALTVAAGTTQAASAQIAAMAERVRLVNRQLKDATKRLDDLVGKLSGEMRKACSRRLRTALYHWARVATQHSPRVRAQYSAPRSRGHSHGRALRGVADRLPGVACAMLKSRTLYDPARSNAVTAATNPS